MNYSQTSSRLSKYEIRELLQSVQWSASSQELDICAIALDLTHLSASDILIPIQRRESPFLGHDNLLSTRELVLGTTKSLDDSGFVGISGANRNDDLSDVDTGDGTVRLIY